MDDRSRQGQTLSPAERLRQAAKRAGELRQRMHERLRREATTQGPENLLAVDDLIDMYVTLRVDDSLGDDQRRRLSGIVRSRLLRVKERLAQGSALSAEATRDAELSAALRASADAALPRVVAGEAAAMQLAERAGRRAAQTVAHISQFVLAQQGVAGPGGQAAAGALAAAPPFTGDYGPDLVDLIETVIAPSTWERNGGPGSIYYYRPLRVLVIRQTGEVHGQIGGTIDALRRAGN